MKVLKGFMLSIIAVSRDRHLAGLNFSQNLGDRFLFTAYAGFRYDDLLHLYDKGGTNYDPNKKRYTDYYETPAEIRITVSSQ